MTFPANYPYWDLYVDSPSSRSEDEFEEPDYADEQASDYEADIYDVYEAY